MTEQKTLKQQLQDKAENPCGSYLFPEEAIAVFKKWLLQKRQDEIKFLPPRFRVTTFIDELLEELKQ